MEKIEILLEKLDNRITSSLAKRLDELDDLNEKLDIAGEEYEKNPSDENREKYNEIIEFVEGKELGVIRDLEQLLEKRKAEKSAPKPEPTPAPAPAPTPAPETPPAKTEEKKEGSGILTLVIGGALLIASFGAINYFRKQ
jgi:hypothetical protein